MLGAGLERHWVFTAGPIDLQAATRLCSSPEMLSPAGRDLLQAFGFRCALVAGEATPPESVKPQAAAMTAHGGATAESACRWGYRTAVKLADWQAVPYDLLGSSVLEWISWAWRSGEQADLTSDASYQRIGKLRQTWNVSTGEWDETIHSQLRLAWLNILCEAAHGPGPALDSALKEAIRTVGMIRGAQQGREPNYLARAAEIEKTGEWTQRGAALHLLSLYTWAGATRVFAESGLGRRDPGAIDEALELMQQAAGIAGMKIEMMLRWLQVGAACVAYKSGWCHKWT